MHTHKPKKKAIRIIVLPKTIIRTDRIEKLWRRVESYHAYVPSSKRTLENGRGRL